MRKSMYSMVLLISIPALLLAACGTRPYTIDDDGDSVTLIPDETIDIELNGTRSSGYVWVIDTIDESVLRQAGETRYEPDDGDGEPGTWLFSFRAVGSGSTRLRLYYRKSDDGVRPPARSYTIDVEVTEDGA